MLVHTEAQGAHAGVVDALEKLVAEGPALFGHGIVDVLHSYVGGCDGLLEIHLEIAAGKAAKGAEPLVLALFSFELEAEIAVADDAAYLAKLEVLAVGYEQLLVAGRGEFEVWVACDLATEVNEDMVVKISIRNRNSAVEDQIFLRSLGGRLLINEGGREIGIGVVEGVIVIEGVAELACNYFAVVLFEIFLYPAEGIGAARGDGCAVFGNLKPESGGGVDIGLRIGAGVPDGNRELVFTRGLKGNLIVELIVRVVCANRKKYELAAKIRSVDTVTRDL